VVVVVGGWWVVVVVVVVVNTKRVHTHTITITITITTKAREQESLRATPQEQSLLLENQLTQNAVAAELTQNADASFPVEQPTQSSSSSSCASSLTAGDEAVPPDEAPDFTLSKAPDEVCPGCATANPTKTRRTFL
jgi:hypothetical protein